MRVLFIKPRFEQPILDETKLTTFRGRSRAAKRPKGPPKIGEILSFRVWVGRPYGKGSTGREVARAICTKTLPVSVEAERINHGLVIKFNSVSQLFTERIAKRDGFADVSDMREFFQANGGLPFDGYAICWDSIIKPPPNPDF